MYYTIDLKQILIYLSILLSLSFIANIHLYNYDVSRVVRGKPYRRDKHRIDLQGRRPARAGTLRHHNNT